MWIWSVGLRCEFVWGVEHICSPSGALLRPAVSVWGPAENPQRTFVHPVRPVVHPVRELDPPPVVHHLHGYALFNMPLSIAAWSCFDYTGSSVMPWWQQLCRNHRSPLCCSPVTTSSGQRWEFEEHLWGEKVWTGQKMGWLRFLASAQAATSSPLQLAWSPAGRNAALSLAGQSASCVLIGWAGLERALLCASAANTPEHTPVFRRSTPLWHRIIACA